MITRVLVGSVVAALGLACLPLLPAQAASPLVDVLPAKQGAFSPNGDGHKDTLLVRYRLRERAHVTVRIPRVGPVDLGTRAPGVHRWRWNGRGAPTDTYRLAVVARTPDGRTGKAFRYAELDRGEDIAAVRVRMTRRTVYPETPGKHDEVWVHSTHEGNATEVRIRDEAGEVVVEDELRQWWSWDGSGLPPGEYTATFFVHDRAGNRRHIVRSLEISTEQLQQESWSTTVAAGDVRRFESCGISASPRYPDGVRVTATRSCQRSALVPRFDIPVDVDPDVTWRLSVTGAGDPAQVYISDGIDIVPTATPDGEGTTTTPWGSPYFVEWDRPAEQTGWVAVEDGSYDVAELTFEVRYWTPPQQRPRSPR